MDVISDEFWAAVESLMPSDEGKRGNRFGDHRLILEGIARRFRTGSRWRDLPADFGPWQTVWKRHHRWSLDGTYDAMFAQIAAAFGGTGELSSTPVSALLIQETRPEKNPRHSAHSSRRPSLSLTSDRGCQYG
jgi:putative transposase